MIVPFTSSMPMTLVGIFFPGVPGPMELVVLAFIVLLLFGKRLPEVMGSLGRSIVEFKKGARDADEDSEGQKRVET
jgi:sec-independent protein translocase protein TatA